MVLLSPSAVGLQHVLHVDVCELYSKGNAINYNMKKRTVLICRNVFIKNVIRASTQVKYLGHNVVT